MVLGDIKPEQIKQAKLFIEKYDDAEKPIIEEQKWMTRREMLSPEYTTKWGDLPLVY
jgi:hypothetical protein